MKNPIFLCNTKEVTYPHPHAWKLHLFNDLQKTLMPGEGLVTFRCDFSLPEGTKKVILRASALGVFCLFLNGKEVGREEMKPGWTDYNCRVFEFEYDITALCKAENTLIAPVAHGWWSGRISFGEYGWRRVAFAGEIEYFDKDGNSLGVDFGEDHWRTTIGGRVLFSDIYDGEYIDARKEDIACFPDAYTWDPAGRMEAPLPAVVKATCEPVRVRPAFSQRPVQALAYREIRENGTDFGEIAPFYEKTGDGCEKTHIKVGDILLLDLGQEIVGRPHLKLRAKRGTRIEIFCAEMRNDTGSLDRGNDGPGGSLYLANYRSALARTVYIASGDGEETVRAKYGFFGFRHLGIRVDGEVEITFAEGEFLSTDMRETGAIQTSNGEVNRLFENILWGQRCNYLSIPTDCPQRDERLGWSGDTQIFSGAATYNADARAFLRKWLCDARDGQRLGPGYFDVIPVIRALSGKEQQGNAAWGDAGVILPYVLWLKYGDTEVIAEHYASMETYMQMLAEQTPAGPRERYGDWLSYEDTPKPYISLCMYANDATLMAKYAEILGKTDRAAHYQALFEEICRRFRAEYLQDETLTVTSQTACLLALRYKLVSGKAKENTVAMLVRKIKENDYTLSTGFIGTGILNQTLSDMGMDGLAYSLLLQTADPSWLYSLRQGATTVWERWNSYTKETGFGKVGMNSFNHYAYGAVAEWMYESMAGIKADPEHPGFGHFILAPRPDRRRDEELPQGQERITSVTAHYDSVAGRIESAWSMEGGEFVYRFTIPEGTGARVEFPLIGERDHLLLNGEKTAIVEKTGSCAVLELPAGRYILQ